MITYSSDLSPEEYLHLRNTVGWPELSLAQATRGLKNASYLVAARDDGMAIGMARVLFDFGYTAYIHDVIVLPNYQRRGVGTALMNDVLGWLRDNSDPSEYMQYVIVATKGKEPFYERLGFVTRQTDELGAGMTLRPNG